jgi:copper chaperone NosL
MRERLGVIALACGGFLGGCGTDLSRPPTVRYGEEACAHCRMIISDDRFAAALVTKGGDTLKFDDIGCLVEHKADQQQLPGSVSIHWVRDFGGGGWLDARSASYVHSTKVHSPMGYNLTALPPESPESGSTLRFADLPSAVAASGLGAEKPAAKDNDTESTTPREMRDPS